MTNKEFIERLKNSDLIYEIDENGNVTVTKSAGEIFENHFKQLEKDLEVLEILKPHVKVVDFGKPYKKTLLVEATYELSEDNINKIEEWVDNDK